MAKGSIDVSGSGALSLVEAIQRAVPQLLPYSKPSDELRPDLTPQEKRLYDAATIRLGKMTRAFMTEVNGRPKIDLSSVPGRIMDNL